MSYCPLLVSKPAFNYSQRVLNNDRSCYLRAGKLKKRLDEFADERQRVLSGRRCTNLMRPQVSKTPQRPCAAPACGCSNDRYALPIRKCPLVPNVSFLVTPRAKYISLSSTTDLQRRRCFECLLLFLFPKRKQTSPAQSTGKTRVQDIKR